MIDDSTRREIDKTVSKALREAAMREPPFNISDLLEHLEINREYYDLEDPDLLQRVRHKIRIGKKILKRITRKIRLHALWLPDKEKIYVDSTLPPPKQEWASFHDATHTILEWGGSHWGRAQ